MPHLISLIPGDGIGPEITEATVEVLRASGAALEFERVEAGAAAQAQSGHPVPVQTVESLLRNRVAIKGPLTVERGAPPVEAGSPPRTYATPNAALRGVCGAFANVRPAKLFQGVPGRYADLDVDLVIVREVSEGIYIGREREIAPGCAEAVLVTTREASERVVCFARDLALREGRGTITAVHKANVLDRTDGLFLRTFHEIMRKCQDLSAEDLMVDAAAAKLVLAPDSFDVIVAPNQYGDILSDLAAAIVGGLGLGPGGNYGQDVAYFEACHGAAPDIAGQGIANPIALVLSSAMMLDHLHERDAAERVRSGVAGFLRRGEGLTPDLGGAGTTRGVVEGIVRKMEADA